MFALWCPVAGCTVLRLARDVVSIATRRPGEIDVVLRCDCGQLSLLQTGRARAGGDRVVHGVAPATLAAADGGGDR